jgi:hypothetical protein
VRRPGRRGSFWQTPTQETLLRILLGDDDDRAAARWGQLRPLDIDTAEAGSFCLLPPLHDRLSKIAADDPLLPRLAGTYRSTWYKNQLQLERLSGLVTLLRERAIEPLVVGGAPIAARWYPQLGLRPVPQLELIVSPDDAATAREVVREAAWRPAGRSCAYGRFVNADGLILVVHSGAPPYLAGPLRNTAFATLREAGRQTTIGGLPVSTLQVADELLWVCALGARTTIPPSIQWLFDAAQLLASPERPAVGVVLARARTFHLVEPLRETVAYLAGISETPDLLDFQRALRAEPVGRRDALAQHLAGAGGKNLEGAARTLALYLRTTADEPLCRAVAELPRHLQEAWETETVVQVPAVALKKLVRIGRTRLRERRPRRGRTAHGRASASSERNRSALS